jgi:2-keto-3-deoxy-L-rhamnonate aldolase RhmA
MRDAMKLVADVAKKHGKAWGRPVASREDLEIILELGATYVIMGGEFVWLMKGMAEAKAIFDDVLGSA